MKTLSYLILFLFTASTVLAGLPPTTLKGQSDANSKVKFNFQVPYNQATNLGGVTSLIETGNQNLLPNASFEASTFDSGWTTTTATSAVETTVITDGKKSAKLTFAASTGDIAQSVTPAIELSSQNMEASCRVKTSLSGIQVCALNAGSEVNCLDVPASNTWEEVNPTFIGPASGSVGVEVKATSSVTGSVYVDDCYVGRNKHVGEVSQAVLVGTIKWSQTASCVWNQNTSSFTTFPANASCPTPTVTGNVSVPSTKIPEVDIANAGPGTYMLVATGSFMTNPQGSSELSQFRFYEATTGTAAQPQSYGVSTSGAVYYYPSLNGSLTTTTANTLKFQIQSKGTGSGGPASIDASTASTGSDFEIRIYKFPSQSQTVSAENQSPAYWVGTQTATTGWSTTSTTYADPTGAAGVSVSTLSSQNITCSAAAASAAGITCNLPKAGTYKVCADASVVASTTAYLGMKLVDGGGSDIYPGRQFNIAGGGRDGRTVCGPYTASAVGSATFKAQLKISTGTANIESGGGETNAIVWTVSPMDQDIPMPVLTHSVSTDSSGQIRDESAAFNCTSGCTTAASQTGSWVSGITVTTTGQYTVAIKSGEFSATPMCTCSAGSAGMICVVRDAGLVTGSPTQIELITSTDAGTYTNDKFVLSCKGPH